MIKEFKDRSHEKKGEGYAQNPNSNRKQRKEDQVNMRETSREDSKI